MAESIKMELDSVHPVHQPQQLLHQTMHGGINTTTAAQSVSTGSTSPIGPDQLNNMDIVVGSFAKG